MDENSQSGFDEGKLQPSSPPLKPKQILKDNHILRQYDEERYLEAVGSYYADIFTTLGVQLQCLSLIFAYFYTEGKITYQFIFSMNVIDMSVFVVFTISMMEFQKQISYDDDILAKLFMCVTPFLVFEIKDQIKVNGIQISILILLPLLCLFFSYIFFIDCSQFFPNESQKIKTILALWFLILNWRKIQVAKKGDFLTEDVSAFEYFVLYEVVAIVGQIIRARQYMKRNTYSIGTVLYCQMHMSQQLRFLCLIYYPTAPVSWILIIFAQSLLCLFLKMKFKEKLLVTKIMRSQKEKATVKLMANTVASFRRRNNKSRQTIEQRNLAIFDRLEFDELCCLCNKNAATVVGRCFHVVFCKECHRRQIKKMKKLSDWKRIGCPICGEKCYSNIDLKQSQIKFLLLSLTKWGFGRNQNLPIMYVQEYVPQDSQDSQD